MFSEHRRNVLVLLSVLVVTTAYVSVAIADTPDNESVEITDDASVWAGAPFVLQASSDDTVSELDESDQLIELDGQGSAFPLEADTGTIKTYEAGAEVQFDYEESGSFDPDEWGDIEDDGQIHLVQLEEENISGINAPSSVADLEDILNTDDVNNNATFTDITVDNAGSGEFSFTLDDDEFDDPGMYAVMITLNETGDGVILDNNQIDDIDGDITVMGLEGIAVEENPEETELDSPDEAEPGDTLEFDVDSDLSGDIHHAVAVYDISQVEDEELRIDIDDNDLNELSADDLTIESNTEYVRGEAIVEDDILVGDQTLVSADSRQGQFGIQQVFDRIATEAGTDVPNTAGDSEILDASMTAVVTDGPSGTITVETNESWEETEYRVVYLASTNTSSDQFRTATDTLTIEVDDDDDTPPRRGGGGGGSPPADDDVDDDVVDDEDDVVDDGDDVIDDDAPDVEDLPPETPTVSEVRQDLDATEPNTRSRTAIVDNDPDRPGVQVNPEETESVREISFSSDDAAGNVDISEWQDPPESVSRSVSGSIAAQVESDADEDVEVSASVPTVTDIDPDSDEVRNSPGTVQITVAEDRIDNPDDVVIAHESGDTWESLETTVTDTENGEITLEAETQSFSLFAVAEVETEEVDDGLGTTGLIGMVVVLALISIIAAVVAYREMNSGTDEDPL